MLEIRPLKLLATAIYGAQQTRATLPPKRQPIMNKLIGILLLFHMTSVSATEIIVITNTDGPATVLTREDLADLYLDRGNNPQNLRPYDQEDRTLRERFYREITGLSLASVRAYWAKRVFTGRGRPPAIIKPEAIEATLANTPNAVTYTRKQQQPEHTKALLSIQLGEQP